MRNKRKESNTEAIQFKNGSNTWKKKGNSEEPVVTELTKVGRPDKRRKITVHTITVTSTTVITSIESEEED